jgi:hypothetical protein
VIEKKGGSEKLKKFDLFMDVLGGGEMVFIWNYNCTINYNYNYNFVHH